MPRLAMIWDRTSASFIAKLTCTVPKDTWKCRREWTMDIKHILATSHSLTLFFIDFSYHKECNIWYCLKMIWLDKMHEVQQKHLHTLHSLPKAETAFKWLTIWPSRPNSRIAPNEKRSARHRFQPFKNARLKGTTRCSLSSGSGSYGASNHAWQISLQETFSVAMWLGSERKPSEQTNWTNCSKTSGSTIPDVPKSTRQASIQGLASPGCSVLVKYCVLIGCRTIMAWLLDTNASDPWLPTLSSDWIIILKMENDGTSNLTIIQHGQSGNKCCRDARPWAGGRSHRSTLQSPFCRPWLFEKGFWFGDSKSIHSPGLSGVSIL